MHSDHVTSCSGVDGSGSAARDSVADGRDWLGEELFHLHLNQKRHSLLVWLQQHTCICTIHAQLHIHNNSFDEFMICKHLKVTIIHCHKKLEVRQWAVHKWKRDKSAQTVIYILILFTLRSRCVCRSKWSVKWWMIELGCGENLEAQR